MNHEQKIRDTITKLRKEIAKKAEGIGETDNRELDIGLSKEVFSEKEWQILIRNEDRFISAPGDPVVSEYYTGYKVVDDEIYSNRVALSIARLH